MSERIWDVVWHSTCYGQYGVTMNAISGVDLAIWDVMALGYTCLQADRGSDKAADSPLHCKRY